MEWLYLEKIEENVVCHKYAGDGIKAKRMETVCPRQDGLGGSNI